MTPNLRVSSGNAELAVYVWGEARPNRPTVVLVHGYPDSAVVWEPVARQLAERFYVVAYDVRGAGQSNRPRSMRSYQLEVLVRDLGDVIREVSPDRPVHLVGHDWGSIQGWEAVTTERLQARIASFTSISGPCLDHAALWLRRRLSSVSRQDFSQALNQLAHSWYIGFLHLPLAAPLAWKLGFDKLWPGVIRKPRAASAEAASTQAEDGAVGVKLYRANVLPRLLKPQPRSTTLPVQLVVPRRDAFMVGELWNDLLQWAPQLWRRDIGAGHWVTLSHPERLAGWIAEFVDAHEGEGESAALRHARVRPRVEGKPDANKRVIVTGAGSGFGRETALLFAERGAEVIGVDIDVAALQRTVDLAALLGASMQMQVVDVGDAKQMKGLADRIEREFGAPDIVVNNAGVGMAGAFLDTKLDDWERVLQVNLWSVIYASRLFGKQMLAAGRGGHIVNVASMGAFAPSRFLSAYNTSKAAVRMLSDCLRAELVDHGIGVSTICPGFSITNITRSTRFAGADEDRQAQLQQAATKLYQKRNLQPQAIALAIVQAVEQDLAEVPVGIEAHASRWISRVVPGLARRVARIDPRLRGDD